MKRVHVFLLIACLILATHPVFAAEQTQADSAPGNVSDTQPDRVDTVPDSVEVTTPAPAPDPTPTPDPDPTPTPDPDPETPTETPETPTETPETPTETPETPTEIPETPTETPETPTETPDTPTETPDTSTETPDTPTETPDTPIETPTDTIPGGSHLPADLLPPATTFGLTPSTSIRTTTLETRTASDSGLSAVITDLFGTYNHKTQTVTEIASDGTSFTYEEYVPGIAGVDMEWVAGVVLFALIVYCVFRIVGGVFR